MKPRIVIGAPVFGDVSPDILEDWLRFIYHCGRRMPEYDFFIAIIPKMEQFRARNHVVEAAIGMNADYLLMLDDDMIINPEITMGEAGMGSPPYEFLSRLLRHDKDICGVLYYQRTARMLPVLMKKIENGYRFLRDDEVTHSLQRVDVAGGGCLLIKMKVFDYVRPPYFEPEFEYGTDIQICRKAAEHGFEVWADTSIEFGHLRKEQSIITSRNRHMFIDATLPGEMKNTQVLVDIFNRVVEDATAYTGWSYEKMISFAQEFMREHEGFKANGGDDFDWYQRYPWERIGRQIWYNTQASHKRQMTEYILSAIPNDRRSILDFGCGIGIPAFALAERGHDVTALDLRGTGTLEFLKWRAKKHGVDMTFYESEGGVPHFGSKKFDVIIAMDCLEHIEDWRMMLAVLAQYLKPNGVLFANNAILDDPTHPEHYDLGCDDFVRACVENGLAPLNQITYIKEAPAVAAISETGVREGPAA